jgi:hypothetical protein
MVVGTGGIDICISSDTLLGNVGEVTVHLSTESTVQRKWLFIRSFIHSFHSLSYDSSEASSPHSEITRFLFQFPVSSRFLKVTQ